MNLSLIDKVRYSSPFRGLLKRRHDVADVSRTVAGRQRLFEVLKPDVESPIVFLGDSITALCEWRELLGWHLPILNRGIGGDTTAGLLSRIHSVIALRPSVVFLMIGTNDLGFAPPGKIADNISVILNEIRRECPETIVYLQSILPSRSMKRNQRTQQVNAELSRLGDGPNVHYLHLYDCLLDHRGFLDIRFTNDGLHLSGDGYLVWKAQIVSIVEDLLTQKPSLALQRPASRREKLRLAV